MPQIQLGEWLPDRALIASPGLSSVINVSPSADGWSQIRSPVSVPLSALLAKCRGIVPGRTQAGVGFLLAGTETDLYESVSADFVELTRISSDYSLDPADYWEFASYGEARYATNGADEIQYSSGTGVKFVDIAGLGGTAAGCSLAKSMAIVEEFLVLGNIVGQGDNASALGTSEAGLHWCAQGNPLSWPKVATQAAIDAQSDFQILHGDGGPITQIVAASEYSVVFRKRQTWRMDYVGAPNFFVLRKRDHSRGATVPGTAIAVGNHVYFLSEEGFLVFDGAQTTPIGYEKVDNFVKGLINWENAEANCSVAHWPEMRSVVWSLPFIFFGLNFIVAYNYELQRWWFVAQSNERVFMLPPSANQYSMDLPPYDDYIMDNVTPPNLGDVNMDTLGLGVSYNREFAMVDNTHAIKTFADATRMGGSIVTGDYEMPDGRRALIRGTRPAYQGTGTVSVAVGGRFSAGAPQSYGAIKAVNGNGVAPARSGGRYQKASFILTGAIEKLSGFDYVLGRMGKR